MSKMISHSVPPGIPILSLLYLVIAKLGAFASTTSPDGRFAKVSGPPSHLISLRNDIDIT
jgi:hypothetical protein